MVQKNPFKGKTTQQILSTDLDSLMSMDRRTLAIAVRRLADTANKRLKSFEEKGIESPAYLGVMRRGGKFSTKGKDVNKLRSEFMRAKLFLEQKTATLRGYEKVKQDFFDRVEATTQQRMTLDKEDLNKFWDVYSNAEPYLTPFVTKSEEIQKIAYDVFIDNIDSSTEDIFKKLLDEFDIEYTKREIEASNGVSGFYTIPDEVNDNE